MKGQRSQAQAKLCEAIALFLAFMGLFWSVLFFIALFEGRGLLIFGPGYVVTAGYIARVLWVRSRPGRRLIWAASMPVQGIWLGWAIVVSCPEGFAFAILFSLWWLIAFSISVVAFLAEPKYLAPEPWWAR